MATLRNLAINTLRDAGHSNIAAGLRHASYEPFTRPLDLLGIAWPAHSQDQETLQRSCRRHHRLRPEPAIRASRGEPLDALRR